MARPVAGRDHPLLLHDDRTRYGLLRRHERADPNRTGRRPLRHQRTKDVDLGRGGSPYQDLYIIIGKTDVNAERHKQQSMVLVPAGTPGARVIAPLRVFGFEDAPSGHCDVELVDVRVPVANLLLGEGRGFEIAQARLGPGRVHHCMRCIGAAERALELMVARAHDRVAFGRALSEQGVWRERVAESRMLINQARLLVLDAAHKMDTVGNKQAQGEIAMIKVVAPNMALRVIDWAIQIYGSAGLSDKTPLATMYALQRALRFIDGPDEVHRNAVAKLEFARHTARQRDVSR